MVVNSVSVTNCDAELVLQAMIEYHNYHQAVIVSGDGDFACLVKYLSEKGKLRNLLVPNSLKYSALLKKPAEKRIVFLDELRQKLEYKKKRTP
ncbi:MAG: NYN domain-containing protein [Candidatus Omnitrophota bacterium]